MKKFKDILNESIEQHILDKICKYIEENMKDEGFDAFLFNLHYERSKFELSFNFKYAMEIVDESQIGTLYVCETNAKNLLENIEKLRNYFKKYKKTDKDFYISNNNYSGLNVKIDLKAEEIINAFDSETSNEIRSILVIDKFNL